MILHAASIAAVFFYQVQQPQCVVQCTQATPELWVKWLLQFALSVVPVAGGVGIAIWSFRATSGRDHARWVLDQKKAEWKEILKKAAEIEHVIPAVVLEAPERYRLAADEFVPVARKLLDSRASCIFISAFLSNPEKIERFSNFIVNTAKTADSIKTWNEYLKDVSNSPENVTTALNKRKADYEGIRDEYLAFTDWIRSEAQLDLKVANSKSHRRRNETAKVIA